jgi:iodotyrosine deiodinase
LNHKLALINLELIFFRDNSHFSRFKFFSLNESHTNVEGKNIAINKSVVTSASDGMELDLKKSFLTQHWEFIILVVTIVYFFAKLRNNSKKAKESNTQQGKSDDEVIASDYKSDELDEDDEELTPAIEKIDYVPYQGAQVFPKRGAQEFYDMMNDRRSVRMLSSKPVDIEVVKKCIHAAGTSPSGAHTEPWTFCLVKELVFLVSLKF